MLLDITFEDVDAVDFPVLDSFAVFEHGLARSSDQQGPLQLPRVSCKLEVVILNLEYILVGHVVQLLVFAVDLQPFVHHLILLAVGISPFILFKPGTPIVAALHPFSLLLVILHFPPQLLHPRLVLLVQAAPQLFE